MIVTTIFAVCFLVGIVYAVLAFVMGHIADLGGHGEAGGDFSHDYGVDGASGHGQTFGAGAEGGEVVFGPFSPFVIAFFLTGFGGVGLALTMSGTLAPLLALPIAALFGLALAWLLYKLFNRVLGGLQSSSEVRINSLIGSEAEVTVAIPPMGIGEIAYVAMGSRCVSPARSDDQVAITRHATVRISRVVGNIFFVRPSFEDQLRTIDETPLPAESHSKPE